MIMLTKVMATVIAEFSVCGMDWLMNWRSVSTSLV